MQTSGIFLALLMLNSGCAVAVFTGDVNGKEQCVKSTQSTMATTEPRENTRRFDGNRRPPATH